MAADDAHSRTFNITIKEDKVVTIRIAEPAEVRAEGLNLTTWTSSYLLARLLPTLQGVDPNIHGDDTIPVLELGAGTGLVGLTAAITWDAPVVLTDLEPIVPSLAHNIALNRALFANPAGVSHARLSCGSLDWRDPSGLSIYSIGVKHSDAERMPGKANVILAADTVYSEEHPVLLSQTILAWLAPGSASRAIICYAMRVAYLDQIRELWQMLEDGGLEAIAEGQDRADEKDGNQWDDELLCEWCIWRWKQ